MEITREYQANIEFRQITDRYLSSTSAASLNVLSESDFARLNACFT